MEKRFEDLAEYFGGYTCSGVADIQLNIISWFQWQPVCLDGIEEVIDGLMLSVCYRHSITIFDTLRSHITPPVLAITGRESREQK